MRTPHGSRLAANRSIAKRECSRLRLPQVLYSNFQGSLKGESYLTPLVQIATPQKKSGTPQSGRSADIADLSEPYRPLSTETVMQHVQTFWNPPGCLVDHPGIYTCTLLFVHCIHIYIYYVHTHTYIIDIYIYTGKGLYIYILYKL